MNQAKPLQGRISDEQFDFLAKYLSKKYGLRVPPEKRILMESRLISRLNSLKMSSIQEYLEYAFEGAGNKPEYEMFVEQMTTHKTFFFRENYQFEYLKKILPGYCEGHRTGRTVTVWSAGCSTGEEVYTLGMLMNESRSAIPAMDFRIIGSDISIPSLKKAARARFSMNEMPNIPSELLAKYFAVEGTAPNESLRFTSPEVMSKINLGFLNLNNNKRYNLPVLDFIFCRNVTIYFDQKTRNDVLERIVERLRPGGYLFLGHSETALGLALPLKCIQPTIYQKIQ